MSDTATEPRSELEQPIWALTWNSGSWPIGNGVTYAEAVNARRTAERAYPDHGEHTITTFAATSRQQQSL